LEVETLEKSPPKRERHAPEVRRLELIEAGIRCLQSKGIGGFTIENIVKEAGVSIGLISRYFAGRNGILAEVYEHLLAAIPGLDPCDSTQIDNNIQTILKIIDDNFSSEIYSRNNFVVWQSLYCEMHFNEELRAKSEVRSAQYQKHLADYLQSIANARGLNIDATKLASDFIALLDGLWLKWCLSNSAKPDEEKQSALNFLEKAIGPLNTTKN
jgi:AcrR family transcriptional regulator